MRTSMIRAVSAVAAAGVVMTATASPAGAHGGYSWEHSIGQSRPYFAPGGPRETFMSGCIVRTGLAKIPSGDHAIITVYDGTLNGMATRCHLDYFWANAVTAVNGRAQNHVRTYEDPVEHVQAGPTNTYRSRRYGSVGAVGQPIVGAHVMAMNTSAVVFQWDIIAAW